MVLSNLRQSLAYRKAFSLVELLVVIAIISVLAGFLLPALEETLCISRTLVCVNNQKQTYLVLNNYLGDYNDHFPPMSIMWDGSTGGGNGIYLIAHFGAGLGEFDTRPFDFDGLFSCPEESICSVSPPIAALPAMGWNYCNGLLTTSRTDSSIVAGLGTSYTYSTSTISRISSPSGTMAFADAMYYYATTGNTPPTVFRHGSSLSIPAPYKTGTDGSYVKYKNAWNLGQLDGRANVSFFDGHVETFGFWDFKDEVSAGTIIDSKL